MIYKVYRNGYSEGKYNLKLVDKFNNTITMLVGGNLDLFWLPENNIRKFVIDESDEFLFKIFKQLFKHIELNDNKYNPSVDKNVFTFLSEDRHEDEANILKIKNNETEFIIDFIKNENTSISHFPKLGCSICFCNSGSRVPKIEQLFMLMFNKLAYYSDNIELVN